MKPNYRRCISCRKVGLKDEFWRIVRVFPSGKVQLDQGMGRSAYICPETSCLQAAQKKKSTRAIATCISARNTVPKLVATSSPQ